MAEPVRALDNLWELVESAAADRPEEVILADEHGRSLRTTDFRDAAQSAAAGLWAHGLRPGDVLSWQLPTTLEAAVLMAACARLGLVQNPIIHVLREREVAFITREVGTRLIIVPQVWRGFAHAEMARDLGLEVVARDLLTPPGEQVRLPSGPVGELPAPPTSTAGCRWIYYSSGTTADPKGVRHNDASVIASSYGEVELLGFGRGDRYPIAWPFAHIGGIAMLVSVLRAGGTLVFFESFDAQSSPLRMAAHRPTILGSATPFFQAYLAAQRAHGAEPLFPALRLCVAGGAPTPPEISREVAETFGLTGITGSWGLTEFPVATSESASDPDLGSTVGRPAEGVQVRVIDGELRLKGRQCFLGYVNAELDAAAFDEEGWFRTGDLGSVDAAGRVRIEGRLKDVIIRNAENVSALEVENTLASMPGAADVAVIGVPDPRTGERVCAVMVAREGHELTLELVAEHCRAHGLAPYKTPELLRVVASLPRGPMGKILKNELQRAT